MSDEPSWTPQPGWGAPSQQSPSPQWGWGGPLPPENKPGIIPLRPLAVGEVLDGAFATIRRHPRVTLGLAAIIAALQALLSVLVPGLLGAATLPIGDAEANADTNLQVFQFISQAVGWLVSGALGTLFTGMIIVVVGEAVLGRDVAPGAVWQRVRPRFWALLGVVLLVGLVPVLALGVLGVLVVLAIVALGPLAALLGVPLLLAALVGFIWLRTAWSLASPALVLERLRPFASLTRSRRLVRGAWWRLFGLRLLAGVIAGAVAGVIAVPFAVAGVFVSGLSAFDQGGTPLPFLVFYSLGTALAATITLPFSSGVQALLYVDRRIRAEALDVRLAEAAASPV